MTKLTDMTEKKIRADVSFLVDKAGYSVRNNVAVNTVQDVK